MPGPENRRYPRLRPLSPVVLHWRALEGGTGTGTVSNMSPVGCYVLTSAPANLGDRVFARLDATLPELDSEVRYLDPDVGMGLEYQGVTEEIRRRLIDFVGERTGVALAPPGAGAPGVQSSRLKV